MSQALTKKRSLSRDERVARAWTWFPWLTFLGISLIPPIVLLIFFFSAATTEAAAVYLFFTLLAAITGLAGASVLLLFLLFYRKRWSGKFRDRLAADGITAAEVRWFEGELTTAERKSLKQIETRSPLLADAYRETLASRLMGTRILERAKRELLAVDRRLNRVSLLRGADTTQLQQELKEDRAKLATIRDEASSRFAETQARLQMIEAAASRDLNHNETYNMLQRLTSAQEHLPLSLEMAQLEQRALKEVEGELSHPRLAENTR